MRHHLPNSNVGKVSLHYNCSHVLFEMLYIIRFHQWAKYICLIFVFLTREEFFLLISNFSVNQRLRLTDFICSKELKKFKANFMNIKRWSQEILQLHISILHNSLWIWRVSNVHCLHKSFIMTMCQKIIWKINCIKNVNMDLQRT